MIHTWILNASPLILLGKAELLKEISPLAETWMIPSCVIQEVAVKSPIASYIADLSAASEILQMSIVGIAPVVAGWDLGPGESEVISLALKKPPQSGVVLDDLQARKCAKTLCIPVIGTLGLVLKAKRKNLIPLVEPAIERLISVGLYIDPKIIVDLLMAVGEYPLE